jgi:uncharacterized protein
MNRCVLALLFSSLWCGMPYAAQAQSATSVLVWTEIAIPTRDAHTLAADFWYEPPEPTAKPVILIQTPYDRTKYRAGRPPEQGGATFPLSTNYHYVIVDWRGFYGSTNAAKLGYDRGLDGFDCVEWIATQTWCNAKVGTWGTSALGFIQYQTAQHNPPHLVCCTIQAKDFLNSYEQSYYGGVYRKEHVENVARLGLASTNLVLGHPMEDTYWRVAETQSDVAADMRVPILVVSGWFDHFPDEILRSWEDLRRASDPSVRGLHKLIMGPWLHGKLGLAEQGAFTYPAATNLNDRVIQYWDYTILGQTHNGWAEQPDVSYFQMGENVWYDVPTWTGIVRDARTLWLTDGHALADQPPPSGAPAATFIYDPADPTPAFGGSRFNPFNPLVLQGPQNQRWLETTRTDLVVYTTAILTNDLRINGPVRVHLHVSSSAPDTDFAVRLSSVDEEDRSWIMTQGIRRGRFRHGYSNEVFWAPGEIVPITVELQHIALTIRAGHRLRIVVSSADYPHYDRNRNDGGPMYAGDTLLVATNSIHQSAEYPSRIEFFSLSADQDGDGLPDAWEMTQFGVLRHTAHDDLDGDGADNRSEYVAGTDPNDPQSFFRCLPIPAAQFPLAGNVLRWPSATGRLYAIHAATNLLTGPDAVIAANLPATPPVNAYTTAAQQVQTIYYKASVAYEEQ